MSAVAVRTCPRPGCDRPVTRRDRLYCSEECYRAAISTPAPERHCPYCGKVLVRAPGERWCNFRKRRYCDQTHAKNGRVRKKELSGKRAAQREAQRRWKARKRGERVEQPLRAHVPPEHRMCRRCGLVVKDSCPLCDLEKNGKRFHSGFAIRPYVDRSATAQAQRTWLDDLMGWETYRMQENDVSAKAS